MPVHPGGADLEGERAHEHLGVEDPAGRPPRPDQLGAAVDVGSHSGRVAGGEDRLRQHQPHPPGSGPRQAHGEGEELGRGVGVRAAAVAARPAPRRARRELGEERRVAEHDVEALVPPVVMEGVGPPEPGGRRARAGRHRAPRGTDRVGVDVDPGHERNRAGRRDPRRGGGQEATVAAGRVEHRDPLARSHRGQRVGDHQLHQFGWCRERATLLPCRVGRGLQRDHGPSLGSARCRRPRPGSSRSGATTGRRSGRRRR